MNQIDPINKEDLEKQQYRFVGNHSAVKVCGWTKNHLIGKGVCYKYQFYGIRSHLCIQSTCAMYCASRCIFCWRGEKAPVSENWYGVIDEPKEIIQGLIEKHLDLLQGFNGNEKADKKLIKEMSNPKHVALSLTGEPIVYPKINELLKEFHKKNISTFLVTNAQYPKELESIENVTQLYLSVDAPNIELFKKVDRPLFKDFDKRLFECLDVLATRKYRTCIRLTAIKDVNMCDIEGYSNLIKRGNPDFIEIKAYMNVGASQEHLAHSNMPLSEEVKEFAQEIEKQLDDYEITAEHKASRVVLLTKKSLNKRNFIDFKSFFEKVNSGKQITTEEYSKKEMQELV